MCTTWNKLRFYKLCIPVRGTTWYYRSLPVFRRTHPLHTQSHLHLVQGIRLSQVWRPHFKLSSPWKNSYIKDFTVFSLFLCYRFFMTFHFLSRRFSTLSTRNINIVYSNNNWSSNCIPPWKSKTSIFLSSVFFDILSYNVTLVQKCARKCI